MRDRILSILSAKFTYKRKDALQLMAESITDRAATEEEAKSIVESITMDQVTEFVSKCRNIQIE